MAMNQIESSWQKKWETSKIFESNPDKRDKFFLTIPYPYISGSLHIGHARVVTEADVFVRYQRMIGKNVLYPIAFHISGTPVLGISLAIKNNDEKQIKVYEGYVKKYVSDENEVKNIVKSFEDPNKIVEFFIPKMINEFKTLGLSVDWRRSYTSGDIEHQALVEWQFKKYKEKNYLVQGKYPILFSLTLNNAVGEDDIKDGDTNPVEMQEFTLIKFKFGDSYLIAATLRPETMYGQTNMWVNPNVDYVQADVNGENWIVSKECAEKLSFQDKKVNIKKVVKGMDLMGKMCFAPFVEREIIILPSLHCDSNIGTGIVTSVPSDAPFDYIALKELKDSPKICEKYHVDHAKVKSIELIPIISSKGYGKFPAVEICEKLKINVLSQHEKLAEATQEIYKVGFHTGVMMSNCGPYSGLKVTEAKERMKKELIAKKRADIFYETSRSAESRDGGKVVVAVLDNQWFIDFNAKGWKELAKKGLKDTELWPEKYRKQFEDVFDWLDKRPCARKRGLGTKLPFDNSWVIESLSDSTIYMALYPIIHIIRENNISKGQLNSDFFDYIFNSKGTVDSVSKSTSISKAVLQDMHKEWNYWYPFDQRHTFNAHLSNHLSFMIFAHAACFEHKHWQKRISFHGMIISGGEKMSKSKGNVITLLDIAEKFGADSFRAYMCNSTSVESTFNWESDKVLVMQKHLESLTRILTEMQENKHKDLKYKSYRSFVSKTERSIKEAKDALEKMDLRAYSNIVLYQMLNNYRAVQKIASKEDVSSINYYCVSNWIKMLCPLTPHLAEELWSKDKNNKSFVSVESWPSFDEGLIDSNLEYEDDFLEGIRSDISAVVKLAKLDNPSKIKLFISSSWKYDFVRKLKDLLKETRNPKEIIDSIMKSDLKKYSADIMKILPNLIKDPSKLPLVVSSEKDEFDLINKYKTMISDELRCLVIVEKADSSVEQKAKQAMPGKPAIIVE